MVMHRHNRCMGDTYMRDNIHGTTVVEGYEELYRVLCCALGQAQFGKGKERHAVAGQAFHEQQICEITKRVGHGYPLGQAIKKIIESQRLPHEQKLAELLGAINYIAASYIVADFEGEEDVRIRKIGVHDESLIEQPMDEGEGWVLEYEAKRCGDLSTSGKCIQIATENR